MTVSRIWNSPATFSQPFKGFLSVASA
jgi:hypothetical protein